MALVPCIVVSAVYILLTMFLAEAARKTVGALAGSGGGIAKAAVLEFIAAAELCGCGFELIISKINSIAH